MAQDSSEIMRDGSPDVLIRGMCRVGQALQREMWMDETWLQLLRVGVNCIKMCGVCVQVCFQVSERGAESLTSSLRADISVLSALDVTPLQNYARLVVKICKRLGDVIQLCAQISQAQGGRWGCYLKETALRGNVICEIETLVNRLAEPGTSEIVHKNLFVVFMCSDVRKNICVFLQPGSF